MSQLQVTGEAKIRDLQGPVVANSGVITALDGLPSQYVRGDGTLADIPSVTGGGSSVSYYLNGSVNQGTFAGSTYYQMSKDAITGVGTNFSSSTDGLLAQFITDANDPDVSSIPSGNWNIEFYMGVSASSGALASFYVEFYKWNGSAFTFLASNVATPEFLTNTTTVDAYFTSVAFPETPLATTDRLAVRVYANVASKTVTMYTEDNRLCQIVTTFSKGLLSMNSLTDQEQYLTVGTAGTDFNIVSSLDTHTFNIPVASATNTGKLSSTDWSTFNNKVPYAGATGPVNLGAYDLTVNDLTIGRGNGSVSDNTAIGVASLSSNTTGANNTAVGSGSLQSNTTGTQNSAFGAATLINNTTGANNVAIGNASLLANINGNQNTAIGVSTLQNNVADENTAIGYAALNLNTFGEGNVAIGISALQNSTVASLNTAVGSYALWNNQTAAYNTAIGASALQSNLTGTRNTTLGWNSGSSITTGSYNTIIGSYTGTSSMSSNVILADGQGNIRYRFDGTNNNFYENVNLGENTYIGGFVQANGTSVLSGTISLKQNGFIPAATGYATIGSVSAGKLSIYFGESGLKSVELQNDLLTASRTYDFPDLSGTLALLEGNQTFLGDKTFDGISNFNTTIFNSLQNNFNYGFQVAKQNTLATQAGYMTISSVAGTASTLKISDGNSSTNTIFTFDTTGSRNYTFPAASGTIALTSNLSSYVPYTGATSNVNIGIYQLISGSISTGNVVSSSDVNTKGLFLDTANTTGALINGYSKLTATKSGTQTRLNYYTDNAGALIRLFFTNTSSYDYTFPDASGTIALTSNIPSVSGTSGQVTYFNGTSSVTGSSNHFWDATNNRLGIGLTNPQRSLEIYSATADSHLRLSGSAPSVSMGEAITGSVYQAKFGLATAAGQYVSGAVAGDFVMLSQTGATIFATTATEKARITSGGNLLVGTTSDNGAKLQVSGAATFSSSVTQSASDSRFIGGDAVGRLIISNSNTTTYLGLYGSSHSSVPNSLEFVTNSALRMFINSSGNVGIGTSSPSYPLHVANSGVYHITAEQTSTDVNNTNAYATFYVINNASSSSVRGLFGAGGNNVGNAALRNSVYYGAQSNHSAVFLTNDLERMRILANGQVNPGADNSYGFGGSGIRWAVIWAANGTIQTSDRREKKDILNTDLGLNLINKLRPVSFKWIVGHNEVSTKTVIDENGNEKTEEVITPREGKRRHYGLIAQEVKEALGDTDFGGFIEDEETGIMGLRYDQFVPILIKSIQEQQAQIEELSNKIVALELK